MNENTYTLLLIAFVSIGTAAIAGEVIDGFTRDVSLKGNSSLEEKFEKNPHVSGADVKKFINTYKPDVAVFVKTKSEVGIIHAYGHSLVLEGEQDQPMDAGFNHNVSELFTGQAAVSPVLFSYENQPKSVSRINLNRMAARDKEDNLAPQIDVSLASESYLTTDNTLSKVNANDDIAGIFTDQSDLFINSNSRFLSTTIEDPYDNIVGVYFEEYGTDLDEAVLTHLMYVDDVLDYLPERENLDE